MHVIRATSWTQLTSQTTALDMASTAFMLVESYSSQLPVPLSFRFLVPNVDGYGLPSDWYMRIMGFAAEVHSFPTCTISSSNAVSASISGSASVLV